MKLTLQQLEAHLWGAANILRGKTAGQDYKNYILSLMFYKRLCDQWECEADDAIAELERQPRRAGEILFRGAPISVRIETTHARRRGNAIRPADGEIVIERGQRSRTPVARSLENWLRKQARKEIERHLSVITVRLQQTPRRVYVMGQRTKWVNCSAERNLSFNLAAHPRAGLRIPLPRHARDRSSRHPGPLGEVLADGAEPVPRDRASEAVAVPPSGAADGRLRRPQLIGEALAQRWARPCHVVPQRVWRVIVREVCGKFSRGGCPSDR